MAEQFETFSTPKTTPQNCSLNPPPKGMSILPLRYGVVGADDLNDISDLPGLGSILGDKVSDKSLTCSKYAVRLLRPGYLYTLEERNGKKIWAGYLISSRSQLFTFDVEQSPPSLNDSYNYPCFECDESPLTVTIEKAEEVPNFYMLYSRDPLYHVKLDEYKQNAAKYAVQGKMQVIHPSSFVSSQNPTAHMVTPTNLPKHVLEFQLHKQFEVDEKSIFNTKYAAALQQLVFPPMVYTESSSSGSNEPPTVPAQFRLLGSVKDKLAKDRGAGVVLFDPIGITQELNDFRNAAVINIHEFLAETDSSYPAGDVVTNERKLTIHKKIQDFQVLLGQAKRMENHHQIEQDEKTIQLCNAQSDAANLIYGMGMLPTGYNATAIKSELAGAKKDIKNRKAKNTKAEAEEQWRDKYAERVDESAMQDFVKKLRQVKDDVSQQVEKRADDHLKWLRSIDLIGAFDTYYRDLPVDVPVIGPDFNSMGFVAEADLCFYGIDGSNKYDDLLDSWLSPKAVTHDNLFMRSYCYNKSDIEQHLSQSFPKAIALARPLTKLSDINGKAFHEVFKEFFHDMAVMEKTIEEWIAWHPKGKATGSRVLDIQVAFKMRMLANAILKTGGKDHQIDKAKTAALGGLVYAKLHELHDTVSFADMLYRIKLKSEKEIQEEAKVEAEKSGGEAESEIAKVVKEMPVKAVDTSAAIYEKGVSDAEQYIKQIRSKALPGLKSSLKELEDQVYLHRLKIGKIKAAIRLSRGQKTNAAADLDKQINDFFAKNDKQVAIVKMKARDMLAKQDKFIDFKEKIEKGEKKALSKEAGLARASIGLIMLDIIALAIMDEDKTEKNKAEFYVAVFQLLGASSTFIDSQLDKISSKFSQLKAYGLEKLDLKIAASGSNYQSSKQILAQDTEKMLMPETRFGGFKLAAGEFMALSAGYSIIVNSYDILDEENKIDTDPIMITIYVSNAIMNGFLAASYSILGVSEAGTWLGTTALGRRLGLAVAGEVAEDIAGLLVLADVVVILNILGLVLLVIELIYLWLKDDPMQKWLSKCTYRKLKKQPGGSDYFYENVNEELDAYEEDLSELFGIDDSKNKRHEATDASKDKKLATESD